MRSLKVILQTLFWIIASMLLLALVLAMDTNRPDPTAYVGIGFLLLLIPLLARASAAAGKRRGASVIAYLEQAVRLNLPLPQMIMAARRSEHGRLAARLGRLSSGLAAGASTAAAVKYSVPELRGAPLAAIESAENLGRLPHTLQRLAQQNTTRAEDDGTEAAFIRVYPFMMAISVFVLVAMIMIFVIPKYETLFHDFGTRLPWMTQIMMDIARDYGSMLLFVMALALMLWGTAAVWRIVQPDSARLMIGGATDRILWYLPLAHDYVRDRGLAEAFDLIADALHAGQPIDHAVDESANLHVNRVLQLRLGLFASWLGSGTAIHAAARQSQMPALVVEMLAPARSGDQVADIFAFLARYYESRFSRTRLVLQGAAVPLMVFFFAIIVTWVALSLLLPMTELISTLSSHTSKWRL